ncbi:MAG: cob(I)yrinic acid a,c-diamide adenosyltransferase [PVC group bacterium]|nr:cob(I)yrinic acid a,c-diamide adenosyltransferase [PVC group bacterium]
MKKNFIGMVQVYTGEGKGKTTAAVGLAVRATAQNLKVCYVSFHKNPSRWRYGEIKVLRKIGVEVFHFARKHPFCDKNPDKNRLSKECDKGLKKIRRIFNEKKYDVLIVDELNICVRDGFLKEEDVLALILGKPKRMELVITGRGATKKIIKHADYVSYIKEVKHPYLKGALARRGIEY